MTPASTIIGGLLTIRYLNCTSMSISSYATSIVSRCSLNQTLSLLLLTLILLSCISVRLYSIFTVPFRAVTLRLVSSVICDRCCPLSVVSIDGSMEDSRFSKNYRERYRLMLMFIPYLRRRRTERLESRVHLCMRSEWLVKGGGTARWVTCL
jgi:hypothetical protein